MNAQGNEQQIALVTGASRGIGAGIALYLAQQGMQVIGTATTPDGAKKITETLQSFLGCEGRVLDVNNGAAIDELVNEIVKSRGGLQVLVNNAGITRDNLSMRLKDEDWDAVINTNLKGVFLACRAVLRTMMKQRYGRIINITSVIGAMGNAGQINYAAAKAGVAGMTRSLAKEVGSRGITVNAVAPGFIETDMTGHLTPEQHAQYVAQIPVGRMGKPEDIAAVVMFLASSQASYLTGQELQVNGGMYA